MKIKCKKCGKEIVVTDGIEQGQHVRCPFCQEKFAYKKDTMTISEDDLRFALADCRKDPELDDYYRKAPEGARLYIALIFYGIVFRDKLDARLYAESFSQIGPQLKEPDLKYLYAYECDDEMRSYFEDRLRALGVAVDENGAVTVKRPRLGLIRPDPTWRKDDAVRSVEASDVECCTSGGGPVHHDQRSYGFGSVAVVVAGVAVLVAFGWLLLNGWQKNRETAQPVRKDVSVEPRVVAPGSNSEKCDKKEKDSDPTPVEMFRKYVDREKTMLKATVAETSKTYDEILNDQKTLSEALIRLEQEDRKRSDKAVTNGWKRYDKAEMVMMILKDADMNALAQKYIGSDFAALRAECRGKIKSLMDMQTKSMRRLMLNRVKYQERVKGIDDDVDKKVSKAQEMTAMANRDLEKRLSELMSQYEKRKSLMEKLRVKERRTKAVNDEIATLASEMSSLEREMSRVKEVVAVSQANVAHVAATMAETIARRRGDAALSARQEDDNAVHEEMANERAIFEVATVYEGRSLDKIAAAMRSRKDLLSVRLSDAQKKIEMLEQASINADMLTESQLISLQTTLSDELKKKILNAVK